MESLLMKASLFCFSGLVISWALEGYCLGRPTMDDSSHISFLVTRIFWELLEFLSERGVGLKRLTHPLLAELLADALIDGMSNTPS